MGNGKALHYGEKSNGAIELGIPRLYQAVTENEATEAVTELTITLVARILLDAATETLEEASVEVLLAKRLASPPLLVTSTALVELASLLLCALPATIP